MRIAIILLPVLLLSGCAFIVKDGEDVQKHYGISQDNARDLTNRIGERQKELYGTEKP